MIWYVIKAFTYSCSSKISAFLYSWFQTFYRINLSMKQSGWFQFYLCKGWWVRAQIRRIMRGWSIKSTKQDLHSSGEQCRTRKTRPCVHIIFVVTSIMLGLSVHMTRKLLSWFLQGLVKKKRERERINFQGYLRHRMDVQIVIYFHSVTSWSLCTHLEAVITKGKKNKNVFYDWFLVLTFMRTNNILAQTWRCHIIDVCDETDIKQ